jgi:uncharacterized membrane-anchored protein YitT (DUF2179 family)
MKSLNVYAIMKEKEKRKGVFWHRNNIKRRLSAILFLYFFMGASLASFSIEQLLIPNRIIDGGVIGSSLILDYLIPD